MAYPEASLERLADVAALERPAEAKRMLVIVNPYATTMSDRLKHLVVYALQGRYDVTAVETERKGHAIDARAGGGAARRTTWWSPSAATAPSTRRRTASPGSTPRSPSSRAARTTCSRRCSGSPTTSSTPPSTCSRCADHWAPRRVDLGRVNGRAFTFAAGMGLDASVVEAVDARPALKSRFGAWYFAEKAVGTFLRRYVVHPPRLTVAVDGDEPIGGVSAFFQNGQPYTYFKDRPINLVDGAELDSGDLAGVVLTRANPVDVPTVLVRALSDGAIPGHRRVAAFTGASDVVVRSADGRPVPWHVDGDHVADDEEVRVSIEPGALGVVA